MEGVESEIGVRIKALRKSNGISRRSFAMMVGLSASCLDEVQDGSRTISVATLARIAQGLGVLPGDLIGGS